MFNNFTYESPSPAITYIPATRYDERGRQLRFVESDAQRQEREALLKARKQHNFWLGSYTSSPCSSPSSLSSCSLSSSPSSSPSSPNFLDIGLSSSPEQPFSVFSLPVQYAAGPPPNTPAFKRGHRRQSSSISLNVIPEED